MRYSDEARFILIGYVNSHNNRYWTTEDPYAVYDVQLHYLKIGFLVCSKFTEDN
jgi:hypothetical protein